MAANDDNFQRDAHLARLTQAAADDEPPAALDAAILAAARREIGARVQVVGGGGVQNVPPTTRQNTAPSRRAGRNWYVPMSIAAVLVLSVSLVSLMQHEKGDELAQPSASVGGVQAPAPSAAAKNEGQSANPVPPESAAGAAALGDTARKSREPDVASADRLAQRPAPTQRQHAEAPKVGADGNAATPNTAPTQSARRDSAAPASAPTGSVEQAPAVTAAPSSAPPAALGGAAPGAAPAESRARVTPPAVMAERRAEPFPQAATEREAREAPARDAVAVAPPAPSPVPRAPAAAEDARPVSPARVDSDRSVAAAPSPPIAAKPMAAPALKASRTQSTFGAVRPVWLTELDNQPPEMWLARLAEFKREGRTSDADVLLAEFRKRFPDHPASAR